MSTSSRRHRARANRRWSMKSVKHGARSGFFYFLHHPRSARQRAERHEYFFVSRARIRRMIARRRIPGARRRLRKLLRHGAPLSARGRKRPDTICCSISTCRARRRSSEKLPDAVSIFILPPDRETWSGVCASAVRTAEEVIQRRLVTATREIENYSKIRLYFGERPPGGFRREPAGNPSRQNGCKRTGGSRRERTPIGES